MVRLLALRSMRRRQGNKGRDKRNESYVVREERRGREAIGEVKRGGDCFIYIPIYIIDSAYVVSCEWREGKVFDN
jgi:hypothetical protein